MNHEEFRRFSKIMRGVDDAEEPEETEKERQRRLRLERAVRLKRLAPENRGGGVPLEILSAWPPAFVVAVLGLPPSVLVDELQRERAEFSRLAPLTLSGR